MTGRTAREATKTLVRFERRIDSHSASVMSSVARIVAKPPALLTSTSTRPQRLTAASTTPCICAGAAASAPKPTASAPVSRRRLAAASAPAPSRSSTARRAPSRANASAVTAPMPRAAPVTMTTRPWNRMSWSPSRSWRSSAQRALGLLAPVGHVERAVFRPRRAHLLARLLLHPRARVRRPEPEATVRAERTHLQLGGEHIRLRKPCLEARDVRRGAPCRDLGIEPQRTRLPAALAAAPRQLQRGGGAGGRAVDGAGEQTSLAEHAEDERLAVDEAERLGVAGRPLEERQAGLDPARARVGLAERRRRAGKVDGEIAARLADRQRRLEHLDRTLPRPLGNVESSETQARPDLLVAPAMGHRPEQNAVADPGALREGAGLGHRQHHPDPGERRVRKRVRVVRLHGERVVPSSDLDGPAIVAEPVERARQDDVGAA